ncbi:MAG TPA: DUF2779 domain-containing protein [Thermomicrobiales bacterium]|nr:DUF2779 domain-containing protein [Thermomicrobiales bacterium]
MREATIYLTKSDFLNYRTCPAYCWTAKYRPEQVPPDAEDMRRREEDEARVEALARPLFGDGVMIESEDAVEATRATELAIASGARTIFKASVLTRSGLHARADVLVQHPSGHGWNIVEVKASTSPDYGNRLDATFQRFAFTAAGYTIRNVEVMYLDKHYRRNGHLTVEKLFRHDTGVMSWGDARRDEIMADMGQALVAIQDPGLCPPCDCDRKTRARRCPTFERFHPEFPAGQTVFDLVSINQTRLGEVLERGVVNLTDWPSDLKLSPRQRWQIETLRTGRELVQTEQLRDFLGRVRFPCYFLDYETFQTPVPLYSGKWPYQQIPFQYSVHILHEDGSLDHREFLWTDAERDPVQPLAESLRADIGDEGSVVVWWEGFEGKRNEELAEAVPELADFLLGLNERMVDLMEAVSRGMWVHPDFGGSSSMKRVLPVVAPEMAYETLEIGHGAIATLRWKQCVVDKAPPDGVDPDEAFEHLRVYCRQDTLGMVRIWEYLCRLAGHEVREPQMALAGVG